jgi:hypothetical protein
MPEFTFDPDATAYVFENCTFGEDPRAIAIRDEEAEACAKIAEEIGDLHAHHQPGVRIAEAIRARIAARRAG